MNDIKFISHQGQFGYTLMESVIAMFLMAIVFSGFILLNVDVKRMVFIGKQLSDFDRRAEIVMINVLTMLNNNKSIDPLKSYITLMPASNKPSYVIANLVPNSLLIKFDHPASFLPNNHCSTMVMYVARPNHLSPDANLYCQCQVGRSFVLQYHVVQLKILYGKRVGSSYQLISSLEQKIKVFHGDFLSIHFLFSSSHIFFNRPHDFYYFYQQWGKSRKLMQDWPLLWLNQ